MQAILSSWSLISDIYQDTLMISGREFILTLIARRSRHYAGTRFVNFIIFPDTLNPLNGFRL